MRISQATNEWFLRRAPMMTDRTRATLIAPLREIRSQLGDLVCGQLTLSDVELFRNELLKKKLSRITVARYLATLRASCGGEIAHVKMGRLISELKRGPSRADAWTRDEVAALLEASSGMYFNAFLWFLFSTGCRRGEAIALQGEDVHLDRGVLDIHRSIGPGGELCNGTKWGGSRVVPISKDLREVLLKLCPPRTGYVFGASHVTPLAERTVTNWFHKVRRLSGVRPFKLHCTRHTAISLALSSGMPLRKASEIFGVSQAVIEKHYAHSIPSDVSMDWASF